jgi:hypothetical protein
MHCVLRRHVTDLVAQDSYKLRLRPEVPKKSARYKDASSGQGESVDHWVIQDVETPREIRALAHAG